MNPVPLIAAAVCLWTQGGSPAGAPTQPAAAFMQRLERVDAAMAAIRDVGADFEQTKKTVMLKKPLVSRGTLRSKGDTVLWETREPREMSMLVTKSEVSMFYPQDRLMEVYPLDARFRDAAGGPLPRLAPLRERFELAELDPRELGESGPAERFLGLRLVPRTEELKRHLASVRVLIDERVPCATRIIITDPDGETTQIQFSNIRINTGIEEPRLRLPAGVTVSRPVPDARGGPSGPPETAR